MRSAPTQLFALNARKQRQTNYNKTHEKEKKIRTHTTKKKDEINIFGVLATIADNTNNIKHHRKWYYDVFACA